MATRLKNCLLLVYNAFRPHGDGKPAQAVRRSARNRQVPNRVMLMNTDRKTDLLPIIDLKLNQILSLLDKDRRFDLRDWLYELDK